MTEYTPPRGMKDIDVEEMEKRMWVYDKIETVLRSYGFKRVEPSFVEHLETLTAKSGQAITAEIYHFKDKSGRDLGLRFDLTVGIARMVANNFAYPEPLKLYAISPMWRYDEPQAGRYRCFWQWDVEEFGSEEPYSDAEVIAVSLDAMKKVGLSGIRARISSRKLIDGILESIGTFDETKRLEILRILDKSQKVSHEELISMLKTAGLKNEDVEKLLGSARLRGSVDFVSSALGKSNAKIEEALTEIQIVWDELSSLGVSSMCELDLGIVRGLDYYDGIVFEGFEQSLGSLSIFGGGRYNKLTGIYGKRALPATGAAGGVERLLIALERKGVFRNLPKPNRVFIAIVSDEVRSHAIALCQSLRNAEIVAEYPIKKWSLRRQLEYADVAGFTHTVIVGKKEVQTGLYALKELKSGNQVELSLEQIINKLAPVAQHG
jgi:histidyl-tRNA synthetase